MTLDYDKLIETSAIKMAAYNYEEDFPIQEWEELGDNVKEYWRELAKAAFVAMQDCMPTGLGTEIVKDKRSMDLNGVVKIHEYERKGTDIRNELWTELRNLGR